VIKGATARDRAGFHLFVYGTLRSGRAAGSLLEGCVRIEDAAVEGTLYDIDGIYPALVLDGSAPIDGEIWWCPAERLRTLDAYEGLADGLFRRVGVRVSEFACWTYVAGPRLAAKLGPQRRIDSGRW